MPALPTLRPNGQGTLSNVNNQANSTTNIYLDIDDDPDTPTTTDYVKNATDTTGDKTAFFLFDDMPGDFGGMTSLQIDCDIQANAFSNDTCTIFARMYQSNETTTLTDEVQVATQAQTGLRSIAFTNVTLGTKAIWDGARLRLRWAFVRNAGSDGATHRVTAAELDGVYTTTVTYTADAVLTGTGDQVISAFVGHPAAAVLSGTGSQVIDAFVTRPASALLTGTGGQVISAFVTRQAAATASGIGGLTASANVIPPTQAAAVLTGTGNLTANANVSIHYQAATVMTGVGNLTASAVVIPPIQAAAVLTGTGTLVAIAQHVVFDVDQSLMSEGEIGAKGYAGSMYAGAYYAGGGELIFAVSSCEIDEEIAGHEYAGECININALYPSFALPQQTYGCGNGYAGGQFAALMYGGGVPCNRQSSGPTVIVTSNVEEFCILNVSCYKPT